MWRGQDSLGAKQRVWVDAVVRDRGADDGPARAGPRHASADEVTVEAARNPDLQLVRADGRGGGRVPDARPAARRAEAEAQREREQDQDEGEESPPPLSPLRVRARRTERDGQGQGSSANVA